MIYLDNGATSFPKPVQVTEAMMEAITDYCANPGRAGHFMAARTAHEIFKTRLALSGFFGIKDGSRIIFTKNCTEALNLGFKGVLNRGDHVVTTSMEHNSVLRPLAELEKRDVENTVVRCDKRGLLDPSDIEKALRYDTRMIAVTAASNVTGTKMPLEQIGRLAAERGILFMVDGAQGAGHMNIDVDRQNIDLLAVPGHKGLLGPEGTGFLYVREGVEIRPLISGGTGSKSMDRKQPEDIPEGYEAGTVNGPGIIGLGAAVRFIKKVGVKAIEEHERKLTERLQRGIERIENTELYGPKDTHMKTAVVAMNIKGLTSEKTASLLNDKYGIAVRAGFHCSGSAHETIGTEDRGCVRLCPGFYTGEREIDETIRAIKEIAESAGKI